METSPARAEISDVLELFSYPSDSAARKAMSADMADVEQAARRLMRKLLRPDEFAGVAALADASAAAQAILLRLDSRR